MLIPWATSICAGFTAGLVQEFPYEMWLGCRELSFFFPFLISCLPIYQTCLGFHLCQHFGAVLGCSELGGTRHTQALTPDLHGVLWLWMELGWFISLWLFLQLKPELGQMQELALCGAWGRQCREGTLELLFGIPSKSSQLESSLGIASASPFAWSRSRASPLDHGHSLSQAGTDVPAEPPLPAPCWRDRPPVLVPVLLVPVLGRAKPAGSWVRSSCFCKQRHKPQKGQIISQ